MEIEQLRGAVLTAVATSAVENAVKSLNKNGEKNIESSLVTARLENYATRIGKVKTLLSPEGFIRIQDFYCPPRLAFGENKLVPSQSDDFKDQVLIEGIVGHGKSVLLRYLCGNSIQKKGRIALFYELRRLDYMKTLAKTVMDDLVELGLPGNSESIKSLSVACGLEVYLDGFDEIDQKKAIKIDRDIDHFAKTYEFVRLFVSSRPYVGLSKNSSFNTYKCQPLNDIDINRLIGKLCNNEEVSNALIKKVSEHRGKVLDLLETPLLVTLLVAQYRQTQQLPEQLSDFYESVFSTLFDRHDSFKVPHNRPRRITASTYVYKKIFEKFCFATLFTDSLALEVADKIALWSMKGLADAEPRDFLLDVAEISSLIEEEDGIWSFIHGSVREYYAASFLMSGSDEDLADRAERLYSSDSAGLALDQIFRFCREINLYRFAKFVEIPYLSSKLRPLVGNAEPSDEELFSWVSSRVLDVQTNGHSDGGLFFKFVFKDQGVKPIQFFALPSQRELVNQALKSWKIHGAPLGGAGGSARCYRASAVATPPGHPSVSGRHGGG